MIERLQISEPEGSGRGSGDRVFDDMEGTTTTLIERLPEGLERLFEGSGRGPGYEAFEDTESPDKEVTPPDYDVTTTLPNLSQADTTDEGIPLALVGIFVLLGVISMGLLYSYLSRSNKKDSQDLRSEDKKVKSLLENVEIDPQSMKHQSL